MIALCIENALHGETVATAPPVTHSPPVDPASAVETPLRVKQHLGLDEERSWIVVSECNEFVWHGFDLRRIGGAQEFACGVLPPMLFERVARAFLKLYRDGKTKIAPR